MHQNNMYSNFSIIRSLKYAYNLKSLGYNSFLIFFNLFFKRAVFFFLNYFKKYTNKPFRKRGRKSTRVVLGYYKKKINYLKFLFKLVTYIRLLRKRRGWINLSRIGYTSKLNNYRRTALKQPQYANRIFFFKTAPFGKRIFLGLTSYSMFNFFFLLDRFLFFTGSLTFKWINGVATLLILVAVKMAVSGELICLWYNSNISQVKSSLMFLKYNTRVGDVLVRAHKILIAIGFATVFLHMSKGIYVSSIYGTRSSTWKTGFSLLLCMFGVSYAGCILPWTVLSPTLYTMVQTILDTYLGGWSVFILLGGEKYPMTILARTLVAHILLGLLGLLVLTLHIRAVHFVVSSVNRFQTWATMDRPNWLPNEIVKETYLLFFFFYFFIFVLYRKSAAWGSFYVSFHKFYYGGATNWNNLPPSIEPEWYFWIFYFALASASSLSGGLLRILFLFFLLGTIPIFKSIQCFKTVDSFEDISQNNILFMSFIVLFFIFYNRSKASFWHIWFLDSILYSLLIFELSLNGANVSLLKKYATSK